MNTSGDDLEKQDGLPDGPGNIAYSDSQKLVHKLEKQKIEIAAQNEELKNAEFALKKFSEHYAQLYHSAPIGYLTLNKNRVITEANPAAARLLGVSQQSLINTTLSQYIDASDQERYHFFIQDILKRRSESRLIIRLKNFKGQSSSIACKGIQYCNCLPENCKYNDSFLWLEIRSNVVDDNDSHQIVLSIIDVTDAQKHQEMIACLNEKLEQKIFTQTHDLATVHLQLIETVQKLQLFNQKIIESEARLNAIFNAAVEGIITINLYGNIISINNKVESIFGYDKAELIDRNITKLIPRIRKNEYGKTARLSSFVGKIREVTGVHKNHTSVPLDLSMAQFFLSGESYLAVIVRDISERKIREQRDKQHLDELAHVTRMGLLGELASGIAHEVNQPLTAVVNYTEAGLNVLKNADCDRGKLQTILTKTSQQALRAGQIIHRMRNLVKANTIHKSTTHINDIIEDAIDLCISYLKQNNIQVRLLLGDKLPTLNIDSVQIEQVVLNLIKNSIDALSIAPASKPRTLSIETTLQADSGIEIRIKDNGIGIETSEQKNILTPFYTTKGDGMGMGLSICRSIIEAHGGILRFNSLPSKGTTFYFTLPFRK